MILRKIARKACFVGAVCAIVLAVGSCGDDVGLGATVDTEAPVLEITYPPAAASVRGTFVFAGTCSDDKEVTSIKLTITNTTTKETYQANDVVLGEKKDTWSVDVNNFEEGVGPFNGWQLPDGKYELNVVAYDAAGHSSGVSARTFEIDNTAPVVILTSPGTTDIKNATAYGSSFKVAGTIADEHTIAELTVSIYDKDKNLLNTEPYVEENVPTAGGTSITMLKFSAESTDELSKRYNSIYGDNIKAGNIPYYCEISVTDNTHEYKEPVYSASASTTNTTSGNSTKTFYLYTKVYEALMSEKSGAQLGLSASDLMTILNGTYTGSNKNVSRSASDGGKMTVAEVLEKLNEGAVNTEENYLAFSLNPAVNPTYTVSGYKLTKQVTAPASQPLTIVVNMGLDQALIKPDTLKAYIKDFGTVDPSSDNADEEIQQAYKEFIAMDGDGSTEAFEKAAADEKSGIICFATSDYPESSGYVENYTWEVSLPETILANHWYVLAVTGEDADGNEMRYNYVCGFVGTVSGIAPKTRITSSEEVFSSSKAVLIQGTSSSSETDIEKVSFEVVVTDLDDATVTPKTWKGTARLTPTDASIAAENNKSVEWELTLEDDAEGYEIQQEGKNVKYAFTITAYDKYDNPSDPQELTVLVDTAKPVVGYEGAELSDNAKITNTSTYFTRNEKDAYAYRLSGAWSDVNGSGTDVLYYTTNADYKSLPEENWQKAADFASATTTRSWNVDLTVGQTLKDGIIAFYAVDKAGNKSDVVSYTGITFDYENPVLTPDETPATSIKKGGTITASGKLTDTLALSDEKPYGITITAKKDGTPYELKNSGENPEVTYEYTAASENSPVTATYQIAIPSAGNDGTWTITVSAKDAAGLSATTQEYTVTVDSQSPTIQVSSTDNKCFISSQPQTFEGTMQDNVLVTNVYYCISSATTAPDDVSVYSKPAGIDEEGSPNNAGKWSANINFKSAATLDTDGKAIKEGTQYYVYFIAKDAVGNISAPSAGVPVKVDDTAPKSTLVGEGLYDATGESATAPSDKATYLAKEAFTVTGEITEENFKSATISVNDGTAVDFGAENSLVTFTDEAKTKWKLAPTLTDGSYKYVISLEDEAENTQSYTITINRDTTGPVVTITSPKAADQISESPVTVRGTTDYGYAGVKSLEYTTDTSDEPEWKSVETVSDNWTQSLSFDKQGTITLKVKATDVLNQTGEVSAVSFYYDKDIPVLSEEGIGTSGKTTNAAITVSGTASDTNALKDHGTGAITIKEGEFSKTLSVTPDTNAEGETGEKGTYTGTLTVGSEGDLSDGVHSLTVTVTDAANRTASLTRVVTVDTIAPKVSSNVVENASVYLDESVYDRLTVSVTESGTGIDQVRYQVLSSTAEEPSYSAETASNWSSLAQSSSDSNTSVWSANIDFTGKDETTHSVYVVATDKAGNVSSVSKATVANTTETKITVDKKKPVISSIKKGTTTITTDDTTNGEDNSTYIVTVDDTNPASAQVIIAKDDEEIATIKSSESTWSKTDKTANLTVDFSATKDDGTPKYPDGTYTLTFRATDGNGRISETKTVSVLKDSTAPEVTITSPTASTYSNANSYTFEGTAQDANLSEVKAVLLKYDGTSKTYKETETTATLSTDSSNKWTWKVYDLDEAGYEISVTATDKVGHTTKETSAVVTVDTIAPTTSMTGTGLYNASGTSVDSSTLLASGGTYLAKATFSLSGEITDDNFDLIKITSGSNEITTGDNSPLTLAATKWEFAPTATTDGAYAYTITLKDKANNQNSYTIIINRDTASPEISITSPETGELFGTANATVRGTASDAVAGIKEAYYTTDTSDNPEWKSLTVTGTSWSQALTFASEGEVTFKVYAVDKLGMKSAETTTTFMYDKSAPILKETGINAASAIKNKTFTLSGTASDTNALKSDGAVVIAEGSTELAKLNVTEGEWSYDFVVGNDENALADGEHTLTIIATDIAGRTTTETRVITVDTTAPVISDESMASDFAYLDVSPYATLSLSATDSGIGATGLANVYYQVLDSGTIVPTEYTSSAAWKSIANNGTQYAADISFADMAEDTYTICVVAIDRAGNVSGIKTVSQTVTVDKTKPVISDLKKGGKSVSGTDTTKNESLTYNVTITDTNPKTASVEVKNSTGTTVQTISSEELTGTDSAKTAALTVDFSDATSYPDGTYTLTFRATDGNGRISETKTVSVLKDSTAPEVTITSPTNDIYSNANSLTFTGTAADVNLKTVTAQLLSGDNVVSVNGKDETTLSTNINGEWTWKLYELADKVYTIKVLAVDEVGNQSEEKVSKSVTVDTTSPTTTLYGSSLFSTSGTAVGLDTSLAGGSYLAKDSFGLNGTITETNFESAKITVAGSDTTINIVKDENNTWSYTPESFADGDYTYTITLTDKAGNKASFTTNIKRDTTEPAVEIKNPTLGEAIEIAETTIKGTVTDEYAGTKFVYYKTGTMDAYEEVTFVGSNWAQNLAFTDEGTIELSVYAVDVLGNGSASSAETVQFSYDKAVPTLAENGISTSGKTTNNAITISGTASDTNALKDNGTGAIVIKEGETLIKALDVTSENGKSGTYTGTLSVGSEGDLPDGVHSLTVTVTDAANRTTSLTRIVTVDTTKPEISSNTTERNYVYQDESPYNTLTVSAEDMPATASTDSFTTGLAGVYYKVTNSATVPEYSSDGGWEALAQGSSSWTKNLEFKTSTYDEGTYYVYVVAIDRAGNVSDVSTASQTITVDAMKPSVSPAGSNMAQIAALTYTMSIADTNPDSAVVAVTKPDDSTTTINGSTPTGSEMSWTSTVSVPFNNSTDYPDGTYTLTFSVTDKNNRKAEDKTITVLKDSVAPVLSDITSSASTGFANVNALTFSGTITEANPKDTVTAELFKDGAATATEELTLTPTGTENEYGWTWKVYDLAEAAYTVKITAKDKVEHETSKESAAVTVDMTAPTTTLKGENLFNSNGETVSSWVSGGTYYAQSSFSLIGEITEQNLANSGITVTGGTGSITYGTDNSKEWTFTPSNLIDNNYVYNIALEDKAGNKTSYTVTVIRDTQPPTLTISNLADGENYGKQVKNEVYTITGTWEDEHAGTKTLQYTTNASPNEVTTEGTNASDSWVTITAPTATNVETNWSFAFPVTADSLGNSISFRAKDTAGNTTMLTRTDINFDKTDPTITITSDAPGSIRNSGYTLTGKVEDALLLEKGKISITATNSANTKTIDAQIPENDDTGTTYTFTVPIVATESLDINDTWTITLNATDKAGNTAETKTVTTTIDTIVPTIASVTAESSQSGKSKTIEENGKSITYFASSYPLELTIDASDEGQGLKSVEYTAVKGSFDSWSGDSNPVSNYETNKVIAWTKAIEGADTWTATIKDFVNTDIAEGTYTIFTHAVDKAGNESYSTALHLISDRTDPALEETDIVGDFITTSGGSFVLQFSASDANLSAVTSTGTVENGSGDTLASIVQDSTDTSKYTITQSVIGDENDQLSHKFTYSITATDNAGNSKTITKSVTIDRTPPVIASLKLGTADATTNSSEALAINSKNGNFSGTVQDSLSGMAAMKGYLVSGKVTADELNSATKISSTENEIAVSSGTVQKDWKATLTAPSEGWYTPVFEATDNAGNTATYVGKYFSADIEAPKSTLGFEEDQIYTSAGKNHVVGTNGTYDTDKTASWDDGLTYIADSSFILNGTVSDKFAFTADTIKFYDGETEITGASFVKNDIVTADDGSTTMTWTYTQTVDTTNATTDGTHTYKLEATDTAGNTKTYAFIVYVDTGAPVVTVLSPAPSANIKTGTLTISGTAFDEGTGVQQISYTVTKGAEEKTGTATVENGKWTASVENISEGSLTLSVTAKDFLNHTTDATAVSFFYDATAPDINSVTITEPATKSTDEYYDTKVLTLQAKVVDATSSVGNVTYKIGESGTEKAMTLKSGETDIYEASVICDEGTSTIYVLATDTLSNKTVGDNIKSVSVNVDATAPVLGALTATSGVSGTDGASSKTDVTFTGTITDSYGLASTDNLVITAKKTTSSEEKTYDASALASILTSVTSFTAETTPATKAALSGQAYSFTLPVSTDHANDGMWVFTVTVKDVAGNTSSVTTTAMTIDTVSPEWTNVSNSTNVFKVGGIAWPTEEDKINWYKDETLSVQGFFSEDAKGSGISTVTYMLTPPAGSSSTQKSGSLDVNRTTGVAKFLSEISGFEDSSTITFTAQDVAGNSSSAGPFKVRIDGTAPEISQYGNYSFGSTDKTNGTEDKDLYYVVTDTESGLNTSKISVTVGNTTYTNDSENVSIEATQPDTIRDKNGNDIDNSAKTMWLVKTTLAKEFFSSLSTEGTLNVLTTISDNAGNSTSRTLASIEIDTEPPTVEITSVSPITDSKVNKKITIAGKANDLSKIVGITLTATGNEKTETLSYTAAGTNTITYDSGVWTAVLDTEKLYESTETKALVITVVATDEAGNTTTDEKAATKTLTIDQNTDRPVIKVMNMQKVGTKYVLKYGTEGQLTGTIIDDDSTSDAVVQSVRVANVATDTTSSVDWDDTDWTESTENGVITATHATYGETKLTLATGEWTYYPKLQTDGAYVLYFYVKDNQETEFASPNTNTLACPYWQFKTDEKQDNTDGIAYSVDGSSPQVNGITVTSSSDADGTDIAKEKEALGTSTILGGTKKRYAQFIITTSDANGVSSITLSMVGKNKTIELSTANSDDGTFTATTTSTEAVWTTKRINVSEFGTGSVSVTAVPTDQNGLVGNGPGTFVVDMDGPAITVSSPKSGSEQTGNIEISGTSIDVSSEVVATEYLVPTVEQRSALSEEGLAALTTWGAWNEDSSAELWKFVFEALEFKNYDDETYYESAGNGKYLIPVYIKATDSLGNYTLKTDFTINHNPDADRPQTEITYPNDKNYSENEEFVILGGTIRITGSAIIPSATTTVNSVYLQIENGTASDNGTVTYTENSDYISGLKDTTTQKTYYTVSNAVAAAKDIFGESSSKSLDFATGVDSSEWWGVKANNAAAWYLVINGNDEMNPAQGKITYIRIRACAVNAEGKVGSWTDWYNVHIDDTAPTQTATLRQYTTEPTSDCTASDIVASSNIIASKTYESEIYLKGDWYLTVMLHDESSIATDKTVVKHGSTTLTAGSGYYLSTLVTGSDGKEKTQYIFIPVSTSGTSAVYTVTVADSEHTISNTYSLNIDNTAPTIEAVYNGSTKTESNVLKTDDDNSVVDSNYVYTLGGTVEEKSSGFDRLVFYYVRAKDIDGKTYTTESVLDPLITAGTSDAKVAISGNLVKRPFTQTVTENGTSETKEYALYAKSVAGKLGADGFTFTATTAADISDNAHIRKGGLIEVGGVLRRINDISGGTVTFDTSTGVTSETSDVTAYFPYAQVVDNTATESTSSTTANPFEFKNNSDDGDTMPETLTGSKSIGFTWDATIHSSNMPDGPCTLVVLAFDKAGNVSGTTYPIKIENSAPRLAKVFLGTDLNSSGSWEANEFEGYNLYDANEAYGIGTTEVKAEQKIATASYGTAFTIKDKLAVVAEIVGGNGDIMMVYGRDATTTAAVSSSGTEAGITAQVNDSISSLVSSKKIGSVIYNNTETVTSLKGFTLTNEQIVSAVTEANDGTGKSASFTFWDFTDELEQGSTSQNCVLLVNDFTIDLVDSVPPKVVVNPFYWSSASVNSIYGNDSTNGHIELEDDLTGTAAATLYGPDPKVSGKITFTGTAYDEHALKNLSFTLANSSGTALTGFGGISMASYDATSTNETYVENGGWSALSGNSGSTLSDGGKYEWKILADNTGSEKTTGYYEDTYYLGQAGHKVYWTISIDTARIPNVAEQNIKLTVTAYDGNKYSTESTAAAPDTSDGAYIVTDGTTHVPSYQMDVVPYITGISTSNRSKSGLKDNNIRSASGKYSIMYAASTSASTYAADFITVKGFNLNPNAVRVVDSATAATTSVSTTSGVGVTYSEPASDYTSFSASNVITNSGYLEVFTNGIRSLNNINSNDSYGTATNSAGTQLTSDNATVTDYANAYNREPDYYTTKNVQLTDDRYLLLFDMHTAQTPNGSNSWTNLKNAYYPVMVMNGDNPVFGYMNGSGGPSVAPGTASGTGAGTYQASHAMPQRAEFNGTSGAEVYTEYLIKASAWDAMGMAVDEGGRYYNVSCYNRDGAAMSLIYDRYAELYSSGNYNYTTNNRTYSASANNKAMGWGAGTGYTGYADAGQGYWSYDAENNAITLDSMNYGDGVLLGRYMYPKLIANGNSTTGTAKVYMAYYDDGTGEIVFRNFQLGRTVSGTATALDSSHTDKGGTTYRQYVNFTENTNYGSASAEGRLTAAATGSKYYDMAVTSDNHVVIVYYDEDESKLKLIYSTNAVDCSSPTANVAWTTSSVSFPSYAGTYVSMTVDSSDGIHIAAFDASDADLKYFYLPSYDSTDLTSLTVDAAGSVGHWTGIAICTDSDNTELYGKPVISYYNSTETGTRESIKMAYPKAAIGSIKEGVDSNGYTTGDWEYMTVPAITPPQGGDSKFQKVCLGFDKQGVPVLGFCATNLEFGKQCSEPRSE